MKIYHTNNAAVGRLSPATVKAIKEAAETLKSPDFYHASYSNIGKRRENAKQEIAHLLGNIDSSCLAFSSSTSDAFAALIQSLPLGKGATIALAKTSFISLRAALSGVKARGINIHTIGDDRGCVRPEDIDGLNADQIDLVVVEWVNWLSGYRNDIKSLAAQCRETNIPLVVDGVQGVGASEIDFNLDAIGALICGGHKWLCGPEGTGFCYVSPWLIPKLNPITLGHRSVTNRIDDTEGEIVARKDASVLEVGTQNTLGLIGLAAALRPLRNNAYAKRVAHIRWAVASIIECLKDIEGITFLTPTDPAYSAGIVTFKFEGIEADEVFQHFKDSGIHCGVRQSWVRMSPGPEAHSWDFIKQLKAAVKIIKKQQKHI